MTETFDAWPDRVDLVVFDFDGVMTDNTVLVGEDGREFVTCSRGDGLGIERLRAAGIPMLVLSKEANPVVDARCRKLQLPCQQGINNKRDALLRYLENLGLSVARVAYIGNDINDAECLNIVGLPVVVADAHPDVLQFARVKLRERGGRGAVREFCDLLIKRYCGTE